MAGTEEDEGSKKRKNGQSKSVANPHGAGRPASLTWEMIARVVLFVRAGNFRETSAVAAGLRLGNFRRWMRQGKAALRDDGTAVPKTHQVYVDLYKAVIEAEKMAEIDMVKVVVDASKQEPEHAKWYLERKFPDRWGRNNYELKQLRKQVASLGRIIEAISERSPHVVAQAEKQVDEGAQKS